MAECPTPDKVRHASLEDARKHAKALRRFQHASQDVLPYQCVCGTWHIGHSKVNLGKRIHRALYSTAAHKKRKGLK